MLADCSGERRFADARFPAHEDQAAGTEERRIEALAEQRVLALPPDEAQGPVRRHTKIMPREHHVSIPHYTRLANATTIMETYHRLKM